MIYESIKNTYMNTKTHQMINLKKPRNIARDL